MPLDSLFRRTVGMRRPRAEDICRHLLEDLDSLAAASNSAAAAAACRAEMLSTTSGSASGSTSPPPEVPLALEHSPACGDAELSEGVRRQLQTILEVFGEVADSSERGACCGGGDDGSGERSAGDAGELLTQFLLADLPVRLVSSLADLEFEARKDVISVFSVVVRLGSLGAGQQLFEYAEAHAKFYETLIDGYGRPEIAVHCGMMLRSCARHRRLVDAFFRRPEVAMRLMTLTSHGSFDVSSDAFSSLHDFLLIHKAASVAFLEANFQAFFRLYNGLLQSDDYVTQRQALKLLSEMLLDRTFMRVMLMYIGDEHFLQIHMNLLRADSKAIQFEAFHVFKIFVANPQKPPRIQQILYRNKDKLIKLLETLRAKRPDDKQFLEDRSAIISKLEALEALPPKAAAASANRAPAVVPTCAPAVDVRPDCPAVVAAAGAPV